jgi:hypothetical protein
VAAHTNDCVSAIGLPGFDADYVGEISKTLLVLEPTKRFALKQETIDAQIEP